MVGSGFRSSQLFRRIATNSAAMKAGVSGRHDSAPALRMYAGLMRVAPARDGLSIGSVRFCGLATLLLDVVFCAVAITDLKTERNQCDSYNFCP